MRVMYALLVVLMLFTLSCSTQGTRKPFTIGVLSNAHFADDTVDGLKNALKQQGYVEGTDIAYIFNGIKTGPDMEIEAKNLMDSGADMIFAISTPTALAAQKVTAGKIPVVFSPASDPVNTGIVDSMKVPGRNTTGVMFGFQEALRTEWLTRLLPEAKNVAILYTPGNISAENSVKLVSAAAAKLQLRVTPLAVESDDWLTLMKGKLLQFDALMISADVKIASQAAEIADFCISQKMPLVTPDRGGVRRGALFSFGIDMEEIGEQAARLVTLIMQGVDAGSIPVEVATFKLSVNTDTARALGVSLPAFALRQAILFGESAPK